MRPLDLVAARLDERDLLKGARQGDKLTALCPAHDDRHASLGVGVGHDGRALVFCHAGCDTADVLDALGLEFRDLFADDGAKPWTNAGLRRTGVSFDRDGRIGLGDVRYLPGAPDGVRKALAAKGSTRDLWPDPASVSGSTLFVVEGEPDAVTGATLGLPTVAVPGASKWQPAWAPRLAEGRERVVVISDADEPGRKAAQRTAAAIAEHCADVRVLDLAPEHTDGYDLSDFAADACGDAERAQARDLLVRAAGYAPRAGGVPGARALGGGTLAPHPETPVNTGDPGGANPGTLAPRGTMHREAGRRVALTAASAIRSEAVRWMWSDRVPLRGLTVLAGEKGLGKSILTNALVPAALTRAELDGELKGEPVDVLVASAEDDWRAVVKPRLMAHGADLDRVHRVSLRDDSGEGMLTLPDDVARLEEAVFELRAAGRTVGLLVIDPIGAFLTEGTDSHKDASVRRALAPLAAMADRLDIAVIVVAHLNKDDSKRLLSRVSGSGAFVNAARSVLGFARDPDDPEGEQGRDRVLVHAATNWGRYAASLGARVESRLVDVEDGATADVGCMVMTGEKDVSVEDLQRGGGERDSEADVEEAIGEALAAGTRPSKDVKAQVTTELGCSRSTVERASKRMRARGELTIEQGGFPRSTTWALTVASTPDTPRDVTGDATAKAPTTLTVWAVPAPVASPQERVTPLGEGVTRLGLARRVAGCSPTSPVAPCASRVGARRELPLPGALPGLRDPPSPVPDTLRWPAGVPELPGRRAAARPAHGRRGARAGP